MPTAELRPRRWLWSWPLLLALALLVPLLGVAINKLQAPQLERDAYASLEVAAQLKAQQVEAWLGERHGDLRTLMADEDLIERIASLQRKPDAQQLEKVRQRLAAVRENYGYPTLQLLSPQGSVLLNLGLEPDFSPPTLAMLQGVFASGKPMQTEIYKAVPDGSITLDFVAPLQRTVNGERQAVAALVLHTEPVKSIFPLILARPSNSRRSETLLVRRVGEQLAHLTPLRDMPDTGPRLNRALADFSQPGSLGSGGPGTARERDYRGVDVLAAYQPVANTDWHVVAQLDYDAVIEPMWNLVFWVGLIALAAIAAISATLRLYLSQQKSAQFLALQLERATTLRESEARVRAVTETARKEAQDGLHAREAFQLTILNSIAAEIAVIDSTGTILAVNEPWRTFACENGIEPGKAAPNTGIGANYFAACGVNASSASTDALTAFDGVRAVLDGKLPAFSTEYPCDSPDQLRWFTMNVTPMVQGAQMGAVITHTNITRIKQAEEQAKQLLAENQSILNNALVGIVHSKQRRIVSCNRRFEEIFQYGHGELDGASTELLFATHETFLDIGERFYRTLGEGKNHSEETLMRHKDGSLFWGALNGCALDPAHPLEGSIWIYADISERRLAEKENSKLMRAVEQSPTSIVMTNREGEIEYVNPNFTRVTGYTRNEVLGQNVRILKSGETPEQTYQDLWQAIAAGKTWRGTLCDRRKDGVVIWQNTSISPIVNEVGAITHYVSVREDVTDRIRIEQQLEAYQIHLEELVAQRTAELSEALEAAKLADKSKDEFLANITHELRTPLSAMIGFSGLARPLSTDVRQREYLDKVHIASQTLASIIDDLLDLSKIVAGRMTFESRPFSLRQLVVRSSSVISYKAREKGLTLVELIDGDIPDVLIGDSLRVEQILLNLLSNAVKFTASGRVELRVGLHTRDEKRVRLNIEVEDTGIGLTQDGIAQLFKPFSQADATMMRKFGGTGLGLTICKRLAELMDGEISVTSVEGVGSVFRVRLCFGLGNAADLPAIEDRTEDLSPVRYRDARVLVVDDQPFNRDVVEGLLTAVGITPHLAENGQQAVDILAADASAFDLVLMDVQMPVMDGLTATRTLRAMDGFADLPIIAITAHTMAHETGNSSAAGMNGHIGKPFNEAAFYRVLAKWLPKHKQCYASSTSVAPPPTKITHGLPPLRGVAVRDGLAMLQGNEARYRHWLSDFIANAEATTADIGRSLAACQFEQASMAAHTLKGRTGLLGMNELHCVTAKLETAINEAEPTSELLLDLQHGVAAMCAELRRGLALGPNPEPALAATPDLLPAGPPPACVTQLIERLQAGDCDCDVLVTHCLTELAGSPWAAHLQQAAMHIQNFDFVAAGKRLSAERPAHTQGA